MVALALLALVAGCAGDTGDEDAVAAGSPSPRSSSTPSPSGSAHQLDARGFPLPERPDCAADAGGTFVRATTSEGNGVGFLLIGTGTGGVVLGQQDNGDICQWLPYAEELATTYRVALFDRDEPRSELLALGSQQDDFFDSQNARQLRHLHPGPETVVMLPGHAHGVDLLDDPRQARVRAAVDRFLARVLD